MRGDSESRDLRSRGRPHPNPLPEGEGVRGSASRVDALLHSHVTDPHAPSLRGRPLWYPNHYTWFVFISALDVMLTWVILYFGGWEANHVADFVIGRFGLPGLVTFKFGIVVFVIVLCEIVGRRRPRSGKRLAEWAIAITCIPVVIALYQLLLHL